MQPLPFNLRQTGIPTDNMITMTTAMITNGITPGPSSVTLAGCDTRIVGNFLEGFGNVSKMRELYHK